MTRFGVNWTPRQGWFHSWLDLDPGAVRADFAQLRDIGLDHVRIFPLWPLLQPNRTLVRPRALQDVVTVCEIAAETGLQVSVDALNGHLSSFDFVPSWLTSWHAADLFTDERARAGEALLVRELAGALRDLPNVTGMTLGNEFPQFAREDHPHVSGAGVEDADSWLAEMFAVLDEAWPQGCHHHSFDDSLWFLESMPFTPRHAVSVGASTTVHAWVFVVLGPRLGANHPWLAWFPRYLCELAAAWSPDPRRRVWLQEVGAPRPWVSDDRAGEFLVTAATTCAAQPEVEAITWWCSHDVSRELADFPELEHSLGLFTSDGSPKPEAQAYAEAIRQLQDAPPSPRNKRKGLVVDGDWQTGAGRSLADASCELFPRWCEAAVDGDFPALVHRDRAEDAVWLAARGIEALL